MKHAWAVYTGHYRITKNPMTEYDAQNAELIWKSIFINLEIREVRG